MSPTFLTELESILGKNYVLTSAADTTPYLTDWRKRYTGKALAVLLPGNVKEVAAIVKVCTKENIAIVPQGGHTGFCGGATPDASGNQVVLNLKRMNQVREIDASNQTISLEAGCILQAVQERAASEGFLFPLSLGAEGSCMIGGNLATNAGGTNVLRYGNTRDLCLGLEVVTAQGEIWNGLKGLRKDNTGYDLRDLFIGSEGTLGIITAAVMKLYPLPISQWTTLVATHESKHDPAASADGMAVDPAAVPAPELSVDTDRVLALLLQKKFRFSAKGHPCAVKMMRGTPILRAASAPSPPAFELLRCTISGRKDLIVRYSSLKPAVSRAKDKSL